MQPRGKTQYPRNAEEEEAKLKFMLCRPVLSCLCLYVLYVFVQKENKVGRDPSHVNDPSD